MPYPTIVAAQVLAISPHVFGRVGQKCQMSGSLDGFGQTPLMLGANACLATRLDFAPIG